MSFAHPWVLTLLVLPVLLGYWLWNRKGLPVILPLDHAHARTGNLLRRLISSLEMTTPLLLAVTLFLLAGPQEPGVPEKHRQLTNIQFCLDISGSMNGTFGDGNRYDGAMEAIQEFTQYREGDAFGLSVFGNEVLHWVPLTKDLSAIRHATPFLEPRRMPPWFGGTQIAKALRACRDVLVRREDGDRLLILVSDGGSSDFSNGGDYAVAEELLQDHIVVYAIHVGSSAPPDGLYTVSSLTGGEVYGAGDPSALSSVFQHIDQMQKVRLEQKSVSLQDAFRLFTIAGLSFLGLQLLTLFGLRYSPW